MHYKPFFPEGQYLSLAYGKEGAKRRVHFPANFVAP